MARVCMRPGCDRPAAARLSYDTISCQVWLDQMPQRLGPVQEICEFHAERLTVPRGWTLCDRRVDAPALFVPDDRRSDPEGDGVPARVPPAVPATSRSAAAAPGPRRSNRRRHPAATARQLFEEDVVIEVGLDDDLEPEPVIDLDADLDSDLDTELDLDTDTEPEPESGLGTEAPEAAGTEEPAPEAVPTEEPALDGVLAAVAVSAERDALAGHAHVMAEVVSVDPEDDLPESLRATSPLLARAFRATGPQRSVLSHDLVSPRSTERSPVEPED